MMLYAPAPAPVATLDIVSRKSKDRLVQEPSEPVYGGYANGRGDVFLFGESLVYRVNFKNQTVQQRPQLNPGAQARYDATEAGEAFEYCNIRFRRLSNAEITEICASGAFRITPKLLS
ncbi:MAG: hypothetical protein WB615_02055 [Candidatus Tumulicola sp.]